MMGPAAIKVLLRELQFVPIPARTPRAANHGAGPCPGGRGRSASTRGNLRTDSISSWTTASHRLARRQGMEPRQLQAAIWRAVKEREQKATGNTSEPFEKLLPRKIAADPEMQALIARAKAGEPAPPRP